MIRDRNDGRVLARIVCARHVLLDLDK